MLAGLDRDAFNADIDPDDDDDMENSELFNQIAKRTNAIASSTKNLMAGAMGAQRSWLPQRRKAWRGVRSPRGRRELATGAACGGSAEARVR